MAPDAALPIFQKRSHSFMIDWPTFPLPAHLHPRSRIGEEQGRALAGIRRIADSRRAT